MPSERRFSPVEIDDEIHAALAHVILDNQHVPAWTRTQCRDLVGRCHTGEAYCGLLYYRRTLTGVGDLDGIVGILLGLYICSRPDANFLDLLFLGRGALRQVSTGWAGISWLALNVLALVTGWFVMSVGATRFLVGAG